jgi:hypothetical protein
VNTVGELSVEGFKDFESSSPKAKIRLICSAVGIQYVQSKAPFCAVIDLLKVRNQLAHPKYERLRYESKEMPLEEAEEHYRQLGTLLHGIEKAVTPEFASRSLQAVRALEQLLVGALEPTKRLVASTSALVITNGQQCETLGNGTA